MEPTESRGSTGQPNEGPIDDDRMTLKSNFRDLPTVIIDPSLKEEADSAREKRRGRRRSKRPRGILTTQERDPKADASEVLSATEADRFAASIRPSWDPPTTASRGVDDPSRQPVSADRTANKKADSTPWTPEIDASSVSLQLPYKFSKQQLLLVLGSVGSLGLLLIIILSVITGGGSPSLVSTKRHSAQPARSVPAVTPKVSAEQTAIAPSTPSGPSSEQAIAPEEKPVVAAVPPVSAVVTPEQPRASVVQETEKKAAPVEQNVRIRVDTSPTKAQLFLDGAQVANPFDKQSVIGGRHQFEARLEGYTSASREVAFDKDRLIYLSLSKARTEAPRQTQTTVARHSSSQTATRKVVQRAVKQPRTYRRSSSVAPSDTRGAGFVSNNPY